MRLSEAKLHQIYTIRSVEHVDDVFNSRINQLGILPGAQIELKNVAPFFKDPMLFNIADSQVALTINEANHIFIEEGE